MAAALLDAVRGETVTHILAPHTHRDHSPNTARIKASTGARCMPRVRIARRAALRERKDIVESAGATATSSRH